MELVKEWPVPSFDLSLVKRGDLLWGKHRTWDEGKAGFVTAATEKQLIVQYHPGIGNVTNHFMIPVSEAAGGQWEIRWSSDMTVIYEYGISPEESEVPEGPGEPDEPENPEKPGGSGETAEPEENETPEESGESEGSGDPEKPGESENPENMGGDSSDTGGTDP